MRIFIIFIAFLPPIIATPAFPQRQRAETGTNEITAPKNNFKPFGDQPFGDQPFGDQPFGEQPFGVWPWESDELDPPASSTDPINLPPLQDSGDTGIYAPPTKPWGCPPDRSFPLCCDGKPYGDDVQTGCSACVSFISRTYFIPNLAQITDSALGL